MKIIRYIKGFVEFGADTSKNLDLVNLNVGTVGPQHTSALYRF